MAQMHISITDEQKQFVRDTFFKLSPFVREKLQTHIDETKNTTAHHGECTVTYGDGD